MAQGADCIETSKRRAGDEPAAASEGQDGSDPVETGTGDVVDAAAGDHAQPTTAEQEASNALVDGAQEGTTSQGMYALSDSVNVKKCVNYVFAADAPASRAKSCRRPRPTTAAERALKKVVDDDSPLFLTPMFHGASQKTKTLLYRAMTDEIALAEDIVPVTRDQDRSPSLLILLSGVIEVQICGQVIRRMLQTAISVNAIWGKIFQEPSGMFPAPQLFRASVDCKLKGAPLRLRWPGPHLYYGGE
ncbi:unnamed protein product [Amoebophrya sp. A120]|nr:unnamed protein product [Amoebophrya sp. A120]|eukprot:GSA120T00001769001.1